MRRSTNSSPESGASFLSLGPGPGGAADATAKDRRPRHALVLGLSATALIFSLVAIANLYYSADPYAAAVRGRGTPAPVLLPGTPLLADHVGNAYLTSRLSNCLATFIRYEPSAYEASWVENAKEWGKDEATYCPTVRGQKDKIDVWIANTSTWMNIRKTSIPDGLGPREQEIFSRCVSWSMALLVQNVDRTRRFEPLCLLNAFLPSLNLITSYILLITKIKGSSLRRAVWTPPSRTRRPTAASSTRTSSPWPPRCGIRGPSASASSRRRCARPATGTGIWWAEGESGSGGMGGSLSMLALADIVPIITKTAADQRILFLLKEPLSLFAGCGIAPL